MTTGGHCWVCSLRQQGCSQQGVYLQRMYAEIGTDYDGYESKRHESTESLGNVSSGTGRRKQGLMRKVIHEVLANLS